MNQTREIVQEAYQLARRGDHRKLRELVADDATWHPAREGAWNPCRDGDMIVRTLLWRSGPANRLRPGETIELGDLPAEFRAQPAPGAKADWLEALAQEVERRLARGESGILEALGKQFERLLIVRALARSGGRRIEAANLLGMGRNTITRKIQELGIEDAGEAEK